MIATSTCRHCERGIAYDHINGWIDPEAPTDPTEDDYMWRATCDRHEVFSADHEPVEDCGRHGGVWGHDATCARCTYESGHPRPMSDMGPLGAGAEPERDRLKNPSINYPRSEEEAAQAIIHRARKLLFTGDFSMVHHFATDSGLGASRTQQQADWLNQQQAILKALLEDVLDGIDLSAKDTA